LLTPVKKTFNVEGITALPRVDILYGCVSPSPSLTSSQQEFDVRLLDSALSFGDIKGLVIAMPDGNGVANNEAVIGRVAAQMPVVRHFRINNGMVAPQAIRPSNTNETISSGLVNTHKSRIMLQLALATGANVRTVFEEPLRSILYGTTE
jgi:L-asparaginase